MSRAHSYSHSRAHSPTFPSLHLRHSSLSNHSVALPSQLILQSFRRFTYVTSHPTLPLLHLRHSSFSNTSVTLPMSQFILQPFRCFTYVTAHSPTLPFLQLRPQFILQPFFRFSYVTRSSINSPGEPLMTPGCANLPSGISNCLAFFHHAVTKTHDILHWGCLHKGFQMPPHRRVKWI